MEGLAQAISLIQSTAQEAAAAQMVPIETHGRMAYVRLGNEIAAYPVPPEPRLHGVASLDDFIAYVTRWVKDSGNVVSVWHGHHDVVALLDDDDRRDKVMLPLDESIEFATLDGLASNDGGRALAQRQFVKLLRVDLAGCLDDETVIGTFRHLDWSNNQEGKSSVQHGRESLGKSINAKVQGVADLPEELLFHVPVYRTRGERDRYPIRCAVEIDPYNQTFQLIPLPGQLDAATDAAQASIRERLEAGLKGVGIYAGRP